ncbi:MAG: dienelactone hydrolase family protein [Chitinophagaceae bacterium]|nr:dienelactone hydrolase family protein [Chitinophagaceae bacterium]MBK7556825.1 dienelactone hydrolase family protein [Chitinophagaceae bacterium]
MEIPFHKEVVIDTGEIALQGELAIPQDAMAIIIFSHGSGSSRFSERNRMVARYLQERKFGTLLFDLLTVAEDRDQYKRFDIDLLTKRLAGAAEWLERFPVTKEYRIGFFGASTGAASALKAAARLSQIGAVVSRGGRPDLAMNDLPNVKAPVLLIVGSLDTDVLQMNLDAYRQLACEKKLTVVEGASHLFEEPGKMDMVSELAASWFQQYLTGSPHKIYHDAGQIK